MLPIVMFDYSTARLIWTIFNFILLIGTILFLLKKFNYKEFWAPLILILFLSYQPLYANILYGQAYILIFCMLVVAWYAYILENEKLLGIAIGLIFIFKATSFIFWLFLLIQKRWKSLGWGILTVSVVILFSLLWIGFNAWQTYAGKITGLISNPLLSVTAYQTPYSFFHHLSAFNKEWNPEPLFNLSLMGDLLSVVCMLIILTVSSFIAFKHRKSEIAFGIFIIAGLIISPVSLDYHYAILLLPILILVNNIRKNSTAMLWAMIFISISLIAFYLPYSSPRLAKGISAILAYPKLYGAIGLWGLYIKAAYHSEVREI